MTIVVEDAGIGMALSEVARLRQAFKQESEGHGRECEGSGLGLTAAPELIEGMGGRLLANSQKGEGTKMYVQMPVAAEGGRPEQTTTQSQEDQSESKAMA